MQFYKIARIVSFICLFAAIVISGVFYFGFTDPKIYGVFSGIIAILATVFGVFASKPLNKKDVTGAVDQVLLTYDKDTYLELQKVKQEEKTLKDFIDKRSEELLLLRVRSYLAEEVKSRYEELMKVEGRLDSMKVQYGPIQLPERFKNVLKELDLNDLADMKKQLLIEMGEVIRFPFFPRWLYKIITNSIVKIYFSPNIRDIFGKVPIQELQEKLGINISSSTKKKENQPTSSETQE